MAVDIFRMNWLLLDTIIIVLLILTLIIVKIFKEMYRFRFAISNESLECISFNAVFNTHDVVVKDWYLVKNQIFESINNTRPLIVIIRTTIKKQLNRVLTEGLGSYGFNVLYINLKFRKDLFDKISNEEIRRVITEIISLCVNKELLINSNYILTNSYESNLYYSSILSDDHYKGMILVNPKFKKSSVRYFISILNKENLKPLTHAIFSRNSKLNLKNKNYKIVLREFNEENNSNLKILSLEKVKNSFKNYETILLGTVLKILENMTKDGILGDHYYEMHS